MVSWVTSPLGASRVNLRKSYNRFTSQSVLYIWRVLLILLWKGSLGEIELERPRILARIMLISWRIFIRNFGLSWTRRWTGGISLLLILIRWVQGRFTRSVWRGFRIWWIIILSRLPNNYYTIIIFLIFLYLMWWWSFWCYFNLIEFLGCSFIFNCLFL